MEKNIPFMDILLEEVENINTLEETILKLSCLLMEAFIQVLDEKLFREKPSYLEPIGFRTRNLATRLGEIKVRRRLYKDKRTGEKLFLLDRKLKLRPKRRVGGRLLRLIVSLAARLPYRQVSEVLEEGYPPVSHTSIHNEVKYFGRSDNDQNRRIFRIRRGRKTKCQN